MHLCVCVCWLWRHAVAQVVEVLRYKPEVAGSIPDRVLPARYGTGVDSASNRNKLQRYLMGVG